MFDIKQSKYGGFDIIIKDNEFSCTLTTDKNSLGKFSKNIEYAINPDVAAKYMLADYDIKSYTYFHINNGGLTLEFNKDGDGFNLDIKQSHMGILRIKYRIRLTLKDINDILEKCKENMCIESSENYSYARAE